MAFARANAKVIAELGALFEARLNRMAQKHSDIVTKFEGLGHCGSLHFHDLETAAAFAKTVNGYGIDISAQVYKQHCPPAVLFKPPLIATEATLGFICDRMEDALEAMSK